MTWVKLDDGIFRHRKFRRADLASRLLYIAGLCLASDQRTDGEIDAGQLPALAVDCGIDMPTADKAAARLCELGLWVNTVDGWAVHDYLEYQRSAVQIEAEKAATRLRVKRHRAKHAGQTPQTEGNAVTNAVSNGDVTLPDTDTDTDTDTDHFVTSCDQNTVSGREVAPKGAGTPNDDPAYRFEDFWNRYPRRHGKRKGKQPALTRWKKLSYEQKARAFRNVVHFEAHCATTGELPCDASRWLNPTRVSDGTNYTDWDDPALPEESTAARAIREAFADTPTPTAGFLDTTAIES